ncbi:MAG: hypothetical protein K5910_06535, partial [Bacteroidales bacterium]|nr:hypothetical protein [Bacteroidales bacterium]
KKYLLSIAALLLCSFAHSQEADDPGNYAEVSIIPRLDLNPSWSTAYSESGFDLGNSSLYTYFEGSASEHFSWTLQNHWFSFGSWTQPGFDAFELFKGLGYSDTVNWIDLMYVDLNFGSWTFTLGKQCMATGGHEYDDDDWLVYPMLATPLWNELSPYQWGGTVSWTTPSEMTTFSAQMTTSPFGARPFGSGLWTWSAQWSGEYDWYSPLWSVTALGTAPHEYAWLICLGNQILLDNWTLSFDWSNTSGFTEEYDGLMKGSTLHGRIDYMPAERLNLGLRGNYVFTEKDSLFENWWNAGVVAEFYPLRDSQDLRLHAVAGYDSLMQSVSLSFGVLYNLCFKLW